MRCQNCGGICRFLLLDIKGFPFYYCTTGLTARRLNGKYSNISPCQTVHDYRGEIFTGYIAFLSDNKTQTIYVEKGKIAEGTEILSNGDSRRPKVSETHN